MGVQGNQTSLDSILRFNFHLRRRLALFDLDFSQSPLSEDFVYILGAFLDGLVGKALQLQLQRRIDLILLAEQNGLGIFFQQAVFHQVHKIRSIADVHTEGSQIQGGLHGLLILLLSDASRFQHGLQCHVSPL